MPCADDSPLMSFRGFGNFFPGPLHVGQEKGNCLADTGNLVVIKKDHAIGRHKIVEIEKVNKNTFKTVSAIDYGEIEFPALLLQFRQNMFRWAFAELDLIIDTNLADKLKAEVRKAPVLIGVYRQ